MQLAGRPLFLSPNPTLRPGEKAVLAITALHLCFLPWALGTMHLWSQTVSAALAATGFAVALGAHPDAARRLVRSPLFWAGLLLLGDIVIQGLNPAWVYRANAQGWWLEPVESIRWLPAGMEVPFAQAGPWRALLINGSLCLLVWSVWIGFTRRKSFRLLLIVLAVNSGLVAVLGILEAATGTRLIYWSYHPSNSAFAASFVYRNHGGTYLDLAAALGAALAWLFHDRAVRLNRRSSPAGLFAFVAVLAGIAVIVSRSRAAIALLGLLGLGLVIRALVLRLRRAERRRVSFGWLLFGLLFLGLGAISANWLHFDRAWRRFAKASPSPAMTIRAVARHAGGEMFSDHRLFGWGAGCFRYGFPLHAQKYPVLCYSGPRPLFWEHLHDDLLEFPIEYGILGLAPVAGVLGWITTQLARRRFWKGPIPLLLVLACLLTLAHAWVDFVFQNPAVLLTWWVMLVAAVRWAEYDENRSSPSAQFEGMTSVVTASDM